MVALLPPALPITPTTAGFLVAPPARAAGAAIEAGGLCHPAVLGGIVLAMRMLLRLACVAAASFASACILAFTFQRRLLYVPEREAESAALERASRLGLEPWRAGDGSLRGWRAGPKARPRARALVFHGNAGSALDRNYYAAALARRGISVTLLEYPGHGPLPGSPSERTIAASAVEAVEALASEGPQPLWLIGESLGSGVAARAARPRPEVVPGPLLVTPFPRPVHVPPHPYPFL